MHVCLAVVLVAAVGFFWGGVVEVLHSMKMLQKITRMYLKIRSISHWSGLVGCPGPRLDAIRGFDDVMLEH